MFRSTIPARRLAVAAALLSSVVAAASPGAASGRDVGAPTGQQVDLVARWTFDSTSDWSGVVGATVAREHDVAHSGSGALAVTSAGTGARARSGRFPVVPGDRYLVSGWASAASSGRRVGLGVRFFDASGAAISAATTIGQAALDQPDAWTPLHQVAAVAPAEAASGDVLFAGHNAAKDEVHLLDDVIVRHASGTPAAIQGPLHTSGPHIIDAGGRVVTLRGLAISGFERPPTDAVPVTPAEVVTAQKWGANFVRVPLAENPVLPGDCSYDAAYLAPVDALVHAITSRGMVALLDLHTNAVTPCGNTMQQPMPDMRAVTFWKTIANRYKDNTLVAFDLFNEPHDVSDSVWHNGGTTRSNGVAYVAAGMQVLYNAVRSTGATNLVMASGTNWAADFPSTAPLANTFNLVYAVHAYTCPHGTPSSGAVCAPGSGGVYDPSRILDRFQGVARWLPVMVTEFGWPDREDGTYLDHVIRYAERHHWAGWSGWAFDGTTRNAFDLVRDAGSATEPTPTGMALIRGFARN